MNVLVIVSSDYGELGSAMYFLDRIPLKPMPVLMLPADMRPPDTVNPMLDIRSYRTLADIRNAIDEIDPDIVLLFSGYLLNIGPRFSLFNAMRLFRLLRRRGVRLATSDPFIGLIRSPASLDFSFVLDVCDRRVRRPLAWLLARFLSLRVYLMYLQLRDIWHIYPAPMKAGQFRKGHRRLSYFNAPDREAAVTETRAVWLFVLSRLDCEIQMRKHGEAFAACLSARLIEARQQGRQVVLIATRELLDRLRRQGLNLSNIELRTDEPYSEYMRVLTGAEYAFFWNYYSFSIIHRVIAGRPVFFFGEGHMVSILPDLAEAGIRNFYCGWKPPLLSMSEPLDERRLEQLSGIVRARFLDITARMKEGLLPIDLLGRVCAEDEG